MKAPTMTIGVEPGLTQAIRALAETTERNEAGVVDAAVAAYLEANAWQAEVIQGALEDVRAGRVPATRELAIPNTPLLIAYTVAGSTVRVPRGLHSARKWPGRS